MEFTKIKVKKYTKCVIWFIIILLMEAYSRAYFIKKPIFPDISSPSYSSYIIIYTTKSFCVRCINAIINHPRSAELELGKKLGLFNSGGGPMPLELIEQAQDMGINYGEGWGMSETTSLGIANPIMGLSKFGSIGVPFPDTDVRLVDLDEGKEDVPKGEPGEIIIKSPLIMKEYWNRPEATAETLVNDWLHTGDIAVQDEEGFVTIQDRMKDMIISGGENVYPAEIERVLRNHPGVEDIAVIGCGGGEGA